jgi:hypothetical protein
MYHIVKGSSTLIFGTKNWLRLNYGVLLAWAILSYALLPITLWLETRQTKGNLETNQNEARKRAGQDEEKNV